MVRLFESLRAVFYAPFYLALELDAYGRRGIEVEFGRPDSPDDAASSLFGSGADVIWGGPMRMMQYQQQHGDGTVVAFAEAVTRDPFYVVGREPRPDFRFADLVDARFASVSEVPTPWLCLQDDIRRAGFDPAAMNREAGRSMAENADALREGRVDAIQVFEPFVEELVHEGAGHVWYAAASRGPTSYTTLYTSRRFAEDNPGTLSALAGGVMDALTWLHGHDAEALAERLQGYFPDLAPARLAGAVARYKANGVWGRDPVLPLEGFVRLKGALISGGFIARDIPFDACVDNRHAKRARDGR